MRIPQKSTLSAIRGSLLGGAVGDALGYPVEFMSWRSIQQSYGPAGIQHYALHRFSGLAVVSDDTQMSLATANGLLVGATRRAINGRADAMESYIYAAYRDWYRCQTDPRFSGDDKANTSWLSWLPEMHANRAPGNTCLSALRHGEPGVTTAPVNNSKGCGGVMRVAPVALWYKGTTDIEAVDRLGAEAAALTHGHPLAWLPSAALVHMVSRAAFGGCDADDGLFSLYADCRATLARIYADVGYTRGFLEYLDEAAALARNDADDAENIRALGEGWVGDEAFGIALYCCLRHQSDFSAAMIAAVNHSGDSDSTGAVAGNLLGAWLGYEAIAPEWLEKLELRDTMLTLADDLSRDCALAGVADDPIWQKRYVRHER